MSSAEEMIETLFPGCTNVGLLTVPIASNVVATVCFNHGGYGSVWIRRDWNNDVYSSVTLERYEDVDVLTACAIIHEEIKKHSQ